MTTTEVGQGTGDAGAAAGRLTRAAAAEVRNWQTRMWSRTAGRSRTNQACPILGCRLRTLSRCPSLLRRRQMVGGPPAVLELTLFSSHQGRSRAPWPGARPGAGRPVVAVVAVVAVVDSYPM